jgi:hypothetical protein
MWVVAQDTLYTDKLLRHVGNNEVNYFITMAGHSSLEPENRLQVVRNHE